jgi:hypothetical protein
MDFKIQKVWDTDSAWLGNVDFYKGLKKGKGF